eukprot:9649602-Lingulodinium_polyedra.AAC.1
MSRGSSGARALASVYTLGCGGAGKPALHTSGATASSTRPRMSSQRCTAVQTVNLSAQTRPT